LKSCCCHSHRLSVPKRSVRLFAYCSIIFRPRAVYMAQGSFRHRLWLSFVPGWFPDTLPVHFGSWHEWRYIHRS
jgi:hypothetical protein